MATAAHFNEARSWLANALEQSSSWRQTKAEDYPDDPRNIRAASALRAAAYYVRGVQASPGVQRIAGLQHDCMASGIDLIGANCENGWPGAESERIAARYFFDHFPDAWNPQTHEELLEDLYQAVLGDVSESGVTPNSPLAARLKKDEQRPAADPVVELLTEIRDLLKERG